MKPALRNLPKCRARGPIATPKFHPRPSPKLVAHNYPPPPHNRDSPHRKESRAVAVPPGPIHAKHHRLPRRRDLPPRTQVRPAFAFFRLILQLEKTHPASIRQARFDAYFPVNTCRLKSRCVAWRLIPGGYFCRLAHQATRTAFVGPPMDREAAAPPGLQGGKSIRQGRLGLYLRGDGWQDGKSGQWCA